MKSIEIAILTYDFPHRKTQDLVSSLLFNGYENITLIVFPWKNIKQHTPLFRHRPGKPINKLSPRELTNFLRLHYIDVVLEDDYSFLESFDVILIGGAGILPDKIVENFTVINAHPGYLPNVRGLDSLKWAILEDQEIGVTTHIISKDVDAGLLIERKLVPIYVTDSLYELGCRIYETEIQMLVESIIIKNDRIITKKILPAYSPVRGRMPPPQEIQMMYKFEKLKMESICQ